MLDRLPGIARSVSLHAVDLVPTQDLVLIETNQRERMVSGLYLPYTVLDTYPTSGWIYAIGPDCKEDLRVGDLVLVEEEGLSLERTYYDIFEITLRHESGKIEVIYGEIEAEPVLRERVDRYRRGIGEDLIISLVDKATNESISFNCSNVVDWQIGSIANPGTNLTYVPVYMYELPNEDDELALFYLTSERRILATVGDRLGESSNS